MTINSLMAKMARVKLEAAERRKAKAATTSEPIKVTLPSIPTKVAIAVAEVVAEVVVDNTDGQLNKNEVTLADFNPKQLLAVTMAESAKSFCLIGAAGSGKTTTVKGVINALKDSGIIGNLEEGTKKVLRAKGPSVAVLSYTNQAVRNIKEALPVDFKANCSTFHKLLEYCPEYNEVEVMGSDGLWTGEYKKSMYYEPNYGTEPDTKNGKGELLPHLDVVIVEEAGSVPVPLWQTFLSALPCAEDTIFIFLGDLNQLPPVFGDGILGYKLLELPIVELNKTYRNVGLVTQFAHRILEGKPILDPELKEWCKSDESGTIEFKPFKKQTTPRVATTTLGRHFKEKVINGEFDTDNDVLLIPFNKQLGTTALNKWLNHGLDIRDNRVVHQVMAGSQTCYFAVGDKVLYNKMYCKIIEVVENDRYVGKLPNKASVHMDRWGRLGDGYEFRDVNEEAEEQLASVESMMEAALEDITESGTLQASHTITLQATDESLASATGELPTYTCSSIGDMNGLLPVLAMSFHKSQGSEWQKVWLILHHSHAVMFKRELLYTGVTRARKDLCVYYSGQKTAHKIGGSVFQQGIVTQELEGDTIEKKLKYFQNKVRAKEVQDQLARGEAITPTLIKPIVMHTAEEQINA